MIKELLTFVVQQMVNNPNDVSVLIKDIDDKQAIEIKVHESDRGKVIGREGQTIKALRMLVNAILPSDKKMLVDVSK